MVITRVICTFMMKKMTSNLFFFHLFSHLVVLLYLSTGKKKSYPGFLAILMIPLSISAHILAKLGNISANFNGGTSVRG